MTGLAFHLIPHTHWDREWYLSRASFEARLVPAVDRVLTLLERNPRLRFHLDGQTVLMEDYLAIRPAAQSRVERLTRDGRLTLGPWYVLADELIPSGESLARNLFLGKADAARLGGGCQTFYSPDAFGHPAVGPLLAAEFGLEHGVLWRGLPNADRRDLVRWHGPAGRSILVLHLPPDGYEFGVALLDDRELGDRWSVLRARLVERAVTPEIAVLVGADHHAPDDRLLDLGERLHRLDPAATIRISTLDQYFAAVAKHPLDAGEVAGELRASGHATWALQGTHSTRARLKRLHGEAELGLQRRAEPLVALRASGRAVLKAGWRRLIQSQFHDTLGGCCADSVAAEQEVRLRGVLDTTEELIRQSLGGLMGHDPDRARDRPEATQPGLVLWNPVARPRGGVVVAEVTAFREDVLVGPPGDRIARRLERRPVPSVSDAAGTALRTQVLAIRPGVERLDAPRHYPDLDRVDRIHLAVDCPPVGGLSAARLRVGSGSAPRRPGREGVRARGATLSNGLVSVTMDRRGSITLGDLVREEDYPGLIGLEDRADRGDCYTPAVSERGLERLVAEEVERLASGPLVGAASVRWTLDGLDRRVVGRTAVTLLAGSPIVRVRIDLDNQASDHRLRLRLPIGAAGDSVAGAAWTVIRRPPGTVDRTWPGETGLPTDPAHRFVAASRGRRGLALMAPGFFEYQWTPRGDLYFTVLRSVGELSKDDLPTRPGHAGWITPTPGAQEPGHHRVEIAIVPIDDHLTADPAELVRHWEDAFLPPVPLWLRHGVPTRDRTPAIELHGAGLVMEAMKPAELGEDIVLRAINLGREQASGSWRFEVPVRRAERVRADETVIEPMMLSADCRTLPFAADPGELVSVRVSLALEVVRDQSAGDHD
jgi:hypothetical protein